MSQADHLGVIVKGRESVVDNKLELLMNFENTVRLVVQSFP